MLWQDQTFSTIHQITLQTRRDVDADYIRCVTQIDDFYEGDHTSWMEQSGGLTHPDDTSAGHVAYLRRYFPDAFQRGSLMPCCAHLIRPLARKLAALFHEAPALVLVDSETGKPADPDDPQQVLWNRIAADAGLAQTLKELQPKTWALRTMFLLVDWKPEYRKIVLRPKTPDMVGVIEGERDPSDLWWAEVVEIELPLPRNSTGSRFERRFLYMQRGQQSGEWKAQFVDQYGKPSRMQPYAGDGLLPFDRYPVVVFHEGDPTGVYQDIDDTILKAQVAVNVLLTDVAFAARMLGSQLVLQGGRTEDDYPKELPFSRDRALPLLSEAQAVFATNATDLGALWSNLQNFYALAAVTNGLTADSFALSGSDVRQALTALSKAADLVAEQSAVKDAAPRWEGYVNDIFRTVRTVWNYYNQSQQLDKRWRVRVDYLEPETVEDRLHQAQADQAEINMGASSVVDKILARRRGITRAEAEDIYRRNLEYRAENAGTAGTERQTPDIKMPPEE